MHLKKLRLSGFKSFVDVTEIPFDSNLCAIVGPNGCGKSNLIDAVRWVLGESSAKNLRSEGMADVIFNGSATRKPVGQASVELLFDNTDGKVGGAYAKYTEISVKRVVNRDSQSTYLLNGTKCRRKDITDLFHGTGLGPRSYSIIEQGMISKLIEAKPEDIRNYLEEVAGISKYKERRREAETKIRQTKDNVSRIEDIRSEVTHQIEKLKRQSEAANRFKEFKEEAHQLKSYSLGFRWNELERQHGSHNQSLRAGELELESSLTDRQSLQTRLTQLKEAHTDKNDQVNEANRLYYGTEAELARIEENISHQKEQNLKINEEIQSIHAELTLLKESKERDSEMLNELQSDYASISPELESCQGRTDAAKVNLAQSESEYEACQEAWHSLNEKRAEASKEIELNQAKLAHIEQYLQSLRHQIQVLEGEVGDENIEQLQAKEISLKEHFDKVARELDANHAEFETHSKTLENLKTKFSKGRDALSQQSEALQRLDSRYNTLKELQAESLSLDIDEDNEEVQKFSLLKKPRLLQVLDVAPGWEKPVEMVLSNFLQNVVTEDYQNINIESLENLNMGLIAESLDGLQAPDENTLAAKVKSKIGFINALLGQVKVAKSVSEAKALAQSLTTGQSIMTQGGSWIGKEWFIGNIHAGSDGHLLDREKEIERLQGEIESQRAKIAIVKQKQEVLKEQIEKTEYEVAAIQNKKVIVLSQKSDAHAEHQVVKSQIAQILAKQEANQAKLLELNDTIKQQLEDTENAQSALRDNKVLYQDCEAEREASLGQREALNTKMTEARAEAESSVNALHELEIRNQTLQTKLQSKEAFIEQSVQRIDALTKKLVALEEDPHKAFNQTDMDSKLNEKLQVKLEFENDLKRKQFELIDLKQNLDDAEQKLSEVNATIEGIQAKIETLKLDNQSYKVRQATIKEQLEEHEKSIEEVLAMLPEELDLESMESKIAENERRIQRLGAINLAAIDEFKEESKRKEYLDKQFDDLLISLETLESAIQKINTATKETFREIFENVNVNFQEIFPKLFGGGRASLILTGDDLISTGVAVMAQPPGKRNTSIHSLSGGEKALAAVALIISIFQINPSPFCILDEVDAPLDDANVGRYCQLIKAMSEKVQFIFITHNKLTMELADQLNGVTMKESGVSRIVSVDVEKALEEVKQTETA